MNAADQAHGFDFANAIASVGTLVRQHFPAASANLKPWRDDPETRRWSESETLDLAFHFPGWTPRLQCRSLLLQLRMSSDDSALPPHLVGVVIRGMTYEGERWRLITVGDWSPRGSHLPQIEQIDHLHEICRDLFSLFPYRDSCLEAS